MFLKFYISAVVIVNVMLADAAFAYIDPNTGGFFFQTIAPFVYGILGVMVVFWKRITGFFKGLFGRNKDLTDSSKDE